MQVLVIGNENPKFVITDGYTTADLKSINNATTGSITLEYPSQALTGTAADLKAALDGFTKGNIGANNYNGKVTVEDEIANLNPTTGDFKAILDIMGADICVKVTGTGAGAYALASLIALNEAVDGEITLANKSVNLAGTVAELYKALAMFESTGYNGTLTIQDNVVNIVDPTKANGLKDEVTHLLKVVVMLLILN